MSIQERPVLTLGKRLAILVSGKAGAGKTTVAKLLKANFAALNYKVGIFPFASGLKLTCLKIGWNGEKDARGRRLLQELGKSGRNYDEDTWVSYTERLIEQEPVDYDIIISDDWRYQNEWAYFDNHPLYSVARLRVFAPEREILKGTPEYNHESETSLPEVTELDEENWKKYYDYIIDNDADILIEELNTKCKKLSQDILNNQAVVF